jgi:tetratricopeptide (TPR) repeat protein
VSDRNPAEIRMELARGHWALAEYDEAIECLLRVVSDAPHTPGLAETVAKYALESQDSRLAAANEALNVRQGLSDGSPLHTATMAKLLAEQGHESQALRVASDALHRNPEDERARAVHERLAGGRHESQRAQVEELERCLVRIRERRHRGVEA